MRDDLPILKMPRPPVADLLGWELLDADPETGRVEVAFLARPEFLNPGGAVQGGILTAMLDDAMGPAVVVKSGGTLYGPTVDLNVSFLAPAKPGRLVAVAEVLRMGRTIAFLQGELRDETGTVVARATATARVVPMPARAMSGA